MGSTKQTFTSDVSQVLRDYEKMAKANTKLEEQLRRQILASKKAATTQQKSAGALRQTASAAVGQVRSMVAGYASLSGAIMLVNRGLQEQNQLNSEIAAKQNSVAGSQSGLLINSLGESDATVEKLFTRIRSINKSTGFGDEAKLTDAVSNLVSATGDIELSLNVARENAKIFKLRPDELNDASGAVGDIATITGDTQGKETIALVLNTQARSRLTSLSDFSNVAQGIAGNSAFDSGEDRTRAAIEAAAFQAALSRSAKDAQGRSVRTGLIGLSSQLAEFLPEKDILGEAISPEEEKKLRRQLRVQSKSAAEIDQAVIDASVVRKGTGLKTLEERINAVQNSPELQRQFFQGTDGFAGASFEKKVVGPIREALTNKDSQVSRDFRETIEALKASSGDTSIVDKLQNRIDSATNSVQGASAQKQAQANIETAILGSEKARIATSREITSETLRQTRTGIFGFADDARLLGGFDFGLGGETPEERAISALANRETQIRKRGGFNLVPEDELTGAEREDLELIRQQTELLRQLLDESRKQTATKPNAAEVGRHTEAN